MKLQEIAKLAGVSPATVSRVFSHHPNIRYDVREHVLAIAKEHNLAVIDLVDGNVDAAIAQLDRVAAKVPEAFVNLGIAYERKGDPMMALDAWRRARKAGVRFAPLADWIEAKERIYGEAP